MYIYTYIVFCSFLFTRYKIVLFFLLISFIHVISIDLLTTRPFVCCLWYLLLSYPGLLLIDFPSLSVLPPSFYDQAIVVNGLNQHITLLQGENSSTVATQSRLTSEDITTASNRDSDAISSANEIKDALSRTAPVYRSIDRTVDPAKVRRFD